MVEESKNKKYVVVNQIKVFVGLPVISKITTTIDSRELKNNEEFEVNNVDSKAIQIKNDRLIGYTGSLALPGILRTRPARLQELARRMDCGLLLA